MLIRSEVHLQSHLRGKKHIEELEKNSEGKKMSGEEITDYNIKQIIDAPEGETDPITIKVFVFIIAEIYHFALKKHMALR